MCGVRVGRAGQALPWRVGRCGSPSRLPGERRVPWASVQALSEPIELTEDEIFSKQPARQLQLPRISHGCKAEFCAQSKMFSYLGYQCSEAERTDLARGRVSRPSPNSPHQLNDLEHGPWPLWASQIPRPWANALSASLWLPFLLYEARHTCNWRALLLAYQDRS